MTGMLNWQYWLISSCQFTQDISIVFQLIPFSYLAIYLGNNKWANSGETWGELFWDHFNKCVFQLKSKNKEDCAPFFFSMALWWQIKPGHATVAFWPRGTSLRSKLMGRTWVCVTWVWWLNQKHSTVNYRFSAIEDNSFPHRWSPLHLRFSDTCYQQLSNWYGFPEDKSRVMRGESRKILIIKILTSVFPRNSPS
jgi:hypothetical protein